MIPRLCFTFWEGDQFSKLHFLTIKSLVKYNPDMKIIIYTCTSNSKLVAWNSYHHGASFSKNKVPFNDLHKISGNITFTAIDFMKEYDISNELSPVYKADIVRIAKLYEHGGAWFDFDLLFIAQIPRQLFEIPTDLIWFTCANSIPTGFIVAVPNVPIVKKLFDTLLSRKDNIAEYQTIGPDLWFELFYKNNDLLRNTTCLPYQLVYPYISYEIPQLIWKSDNRQLSSDTFAIHWYNGDPNVKKFIDNLDFNNLSPNRSVLEKYIYMASA
jgi:hypothetical protein